MNKPLISIIIPTHNSELTIEKCINSLTSQDFSREQFEIIVVDDGSTDNTTNIAKKANANQVIITEPCFQGKARNIGVENSKGDFLAFLDSDCVANKGWLQTIKKELPKSQAVSGPILNGNPKSLIAWAEYFIEFCGFNEYKKRHVPLMMPGCNIACAKEVFLKSGGFTDIRMSEDVLFSEKLKKLGIKQYFVPKLSIQHLCRTKFNKVSSNMRTLGKFYVRNRRVIPTLQHSNLKNSRWLILVGFIHKLGASLLWAIEAKKISKYVSTFPFVFLATISYSRGISEELKQKNTINKEQI